MPSAAGPEVGLRVHPRVIGLVEDRLVVEPLESREPVAGRFAALPPGDLAVAPGEQALDGPAHPGQAGLRADRRRPSRTPPAPVDRPEHQPEREIALPATAANPRSLPGGSSMEDPGDDAAWDALDRFMHELKDDRDSPRPHLAAVSALREGVEADLAFLWSDPGGQVLEVVGDDAPTSRWCDRVARGLSSELTRGGLWERRDGCDWPIEDGPVATAAVVLPVEAPRPSWLIALRLGEAPPFVRSDLRLVRVVWRLQAGHRPPRQRLRQPEGDPLRDRPLPLDGHRREGPATPAATASGSRGSRSGSARR